MDGVAWLANTSAIAVFHWSACDDDLRSEGSVAAELLGTLIVAAFLLHGFIKVDTADRVKLRYNF